jgi:hypothetical protein
MRYRYAWGPRFTVPGLPVLDRKGEICELIARGRMNSAMVRFTDGLTAIISRNALRRLTADPDRSSAQPKEECSGTEAA